MGYDSSQIGNLLLVDRVVRRTRLQPSVCSCGWQYLISLCVDLAGRRRVLNLFVIQRFLIYFVTSTCLLLPVMNISCAICRELFVAASDVFTTDCGHLFHYACLIQWIERYYLFLLNYIWSFICTLKFMTCSLPYHPV
jgi:hypothetical protein